METQVKDTTVSFRMTDEKKKALDSISDLIDRDRSYILNEAVDNYLEIYNWQVKHIEEGIEQANRKEFVPESQWRKSFNRKK